MRLADFRVLSFDCYGTLIDWEWGILSALGPLLARAGDSLAPDEALSAFGKHESRLESESPARLYPTVLENVYEALADEWGLESEVSEAVTFGASVGNWPAFPDSSDALRDLSRHYKLVILSNVDRDSFARSQHRLSVPFDYVFTAEDIGSYKPSLRNFDHMIRHLEEAGFAKNEILHTAQSLFHDHVPANQVGLRTAWINRQAGRYGATPQPATMPRIDFEFGSLADMALAVETELAAEQ